MKNFLYFFFYQIRNKKKNVCMLSFKLYNILSSNKSHLFIGYWLWHHALKFDLIKNLLKVMLRACHYITILCVCPRIDYENKPIIEKKSLSYHKFKVDVQDNSKSSAPFLYTLVTLNYFFWIADIFIIFMIIFLKKVELSIVENFRFNQVGLVPKKFMTLFYLI